MYQGWWEAVAACWLFDGSLNYTCGSRGTERGRALMHRYTVCWSGAIILLCRRACITVTPMSFFTALHVLDLLRSALLEVLDGGVEWLVRAWTSVLD